MKKICFLFILFLYSGSLLSFGEDKGAQIPLLSLPTIPKKVAPTQPIPVKLPSLSLSYPQKEPLNLNLFDFSGGLNQKAFPTELKDNEAQVLNNALWDKFGALRRRKGWTHLGIPDSTNTNGINGLFRFYKQDGTRYLLIGGDTALYRAKNDSSSFVKIRGAIPTGGDFNFANYKDNLYIVNYKTDPLWYSGTTLYNLGEKIDSCKPISNFGGGYCSTFVNIDPKGWNTDQWVGYIGCQIDGVSPGCGFIKKNTYNTIKFYSFNLAGGVDTTKYIYIYPYFYDDTTIIARGTVDSVHYYTCHQKLWDSTWTVGQFDNSFFWVVEMLSGKEVGEVYFPESTYTNYIDVRVPWGDSIKAGAQYKIYKKAFYRPKFVTVFNNRLILINNRTDENWVAYSTQSNPQDFAPLNFFTTYTPDGSKITGVSGLFNDQYGQRNSSSDRLLIFKDNDLIGTENTFIPYIISTGVGAVAPRSIVNCEGQFVGFAHTTGFYGTDGNKVTKLSEKIQPFWDNISKTSIDKIACGYNPEIRSIFCSVPYGSSTKNDTGLIYNIDNQSWSTASLKASVFANQWGLQDTVKFIWGRPDIGWVCKYGLSNLDNGTDSVVLSYRSKEFDFGNLNLIKKFQELYVAYDKTQPLTFNFYKDFGSSAVYSTNLTGTGKNIVRISLSNDIQGKTISWGISTKDPGITIGGVWIKLKSFGGL